MLRLCPAVLRLALELGFCSDTFYPAKRDKFKSESSAAHSVWLSPRISSWWKSDAPCTCFKACMEGCSRTGDGNALDSDNESDDEASSKTDGKIDGETDGETGTEAGLQAGTEFDSDFETDIETSIDVIFDC